jgi:hypothetical protein
MLARPDPEALHRVLVMHGGAVDRPVGPLAIGGPDGVDTGGLQHALAVTMMLERHGELEQIDVVADPLVLLAGRILVADDLRRVHLVVFHGVHVGLEYFHQRGVGRRAHVGRHPAPGPAAGAALGKAPFGGAEARAVLDLVENGRGRHCLVRMTADRAHLEVPVNLVVDGEVLPFLYHQFQVVAVAAGDRAVVNFNRHADLLG